MARVRRGHPLDSRQSRFLRDRFFYGSVTHYQPRKILMRFSFPSLAPFAAFPFAIALSIALSPTACVAETATETEFVSLFDGESLEGWKVSEENPESWMVEDGMIKCAGPRAHLFYVGEDEPFTNFHFKADVKVMPGSNSGIYFHTKYQEQGWPRYGYECQVNVSGSDPKKTSSLYAVENVDAATLEANGIEAGQWYTQEIIVEDRHIVLKVNGKTLVDHTEPESKEAFNEMFDRRLGTGTFALQAHDPDSVAYFKNLQVKKLD